MTAENDFPSLREVESFFDAQLEKWDDARHRFHNLSQAMFRPLSEGGVRLAAQFNPSRIVSTRANTDRDGIAGRPCFLCEANRPPQQIMLPAFGGGFQVLVNPFPILEGHLVIACGGHVEQRLCGRYRNMCVMACGMPGYMVFYNGPKCGASAPDHMHFQAGRRGTVPIERDWDVYESLLRPVAFASGLYELADYACPALCIVGSMEESVVVFESLYERLQSRSGTEEFPMNVLVWDEGGRIITVVFLRRKHRPDCYFHEGAERLLVSPGSVDMGGLLITPRREDFESLTPQRASALLGEVAFSGEEIRKLIG